jgi:hypothetical protein
MIWRVGFSWRKNNWEEKTKTFFRGQTKGVSNKSKFTSSSIKVQQSLKVSSSFLFHIFYSLKHHFLGKYLSLSLLRVTVRSNRQTDCFKDRHRVDSRNSRLKTKQEVCSCLSHAFTNTLILHSLTNTRYIIYVEVYR